MFFLPGHLYVRNIIKNDDDQKFSILILRSSKKTNTDVAYYVEYIKTFSDGSVARLGGYVRGRYDDLEYSTLYTQIKKQKC